MHLVVGAEVGQLNRPSVEADAVPAHARKTIKILIINRQRLLVGDEIAQG